MNSMTADGMDAPWWDDYEYYDCPDCDGRGCIRDKYFTHEFNRCRRCDGTGEIKVNY
jgi:DnaJ-class molecular chaperone